MLEALQYSIVTMKSAGLSSTYRNMLRRTVKITAFAAQHENHLVAKEKQKSLRRAAACAQFLRQKNADTSSPDGKQSPDAADDSSCEEIRNNP